MNDERDMRENAQESAELPEAAVENAPADNSAATEKPEAAEKTSEVSEAVEEAPTFVPQVTTKTLREILESKPSVAEETEVDPPVAQATAQEPIEAPAAEQPVVEQPVQPSAAVPPQPEPAPYQQYQQYQPPQYQGQYYPPVYGQPQYGWQEQQYTQQPQQPYYGAAQQQMPQYQPPQQQNYGGYQPQPQYQNYQYPQQPNQQYGYYQAPQQPYYGAPYTPGQKKKLPVGLKVFFWIAGVLSALAVAGFIGYMVYSIMSIEPVKEQNRFEYNFGYEESLPDFGDFFGGEYEYEFPELTPETESEFVQPDIEIVPNEDGITINPKPESEELDAQEIYAIVEPSTVTVEVTLPSSEDGEPASRGTGIIATGDGYIITNSHVILNTKQVYIKITTYDGAEYEGIVVGFDRTSDLAVLKIDGENLTPAEFGDAEELEIGEWVLAIGNPGGEKYTGSFTRGIISGLEREAGQYSENGMTYIQTDAAVNPGNSGGPLVNMHGQVVGINSSKIVTEGYEGMSFAIPVSKAKPIIDVLLAGSYVEGRARLGITGYDVTEEQSIMSGVPTGFLISVINEDSAFVGTDAEVGDIITEINGEAVSGVDDIANELLKYAPGDTISVTLYRMGDSDSEEGSFEVEIVLLEDKGETQG